MMPHDPPSLRGNERIPFRESDPSTEEIRVLANVTGPPQVANVWKTSGLHDVTRWVMPLAGHG